GPASEHALARIRDLRRYRGEESFPADSADETLTLDALSSAPPEDLSRRMTDSKTTGGDKTISVAQKPRLGLKRGPGVERDMVRQTFSHGRTNTVHVERKERRVVVPA